MPFRNCHLNSFKKDNMYDRNQTEIEKKVTVRYRNIRGKDYLPRSPV